MSAFVIIFVYYLIGSIPFGLVGKFFFKIQDPRTFGSKNIGATNILRSGNKKAAAFTLFFDMFKGFFAVFIASYIETDLIYLAILAVVFGHIFPIYLLFKGGKGVATFLGALLSYSSVVGGLTLLTWITVFYLTRKSSVAGISAIVLSNFFLLFFKKIVSAANGPDILKFDLFNVFIAGLIIFSSSLKTSILSQ